MLPSLSLYVYVYIYIYLPETLPGGYLFRLQDVEKQRERRKTKAKKGRNKKKKTGKHEKKKMWGFSWPIFTIKLGKK